MSEDMKKTKEVIKGMCGNGRRGEFSCCGGGGREGGGSRLPLPLNKQRVIVGQVVPLSCSAGSALIKPSTAPTHRPTDPPPAARVLHTAAHI